MHNSVGIQFIQLILAELDSENNLHSPKWSFKSNLIISYSTTTSLITQSNLHTKSSGTSTFFNALPVSHSLSSLRSPFMSHPPQPGSFFKRRRTQPAMDYDALPVPSSKHEASDFLQTLLNKNLRVTTTDSRMFWGSFKCTDAVSFFSYLVSSLLPTPPTLYTNSFLFL